MSLDADGYPREADLRDIAKFDVVKGNVRELLSLVHDCWKWADPISANNRGGFHWKGRRLRLVTGGWSGNEEVIEALHKNFWFWAQYWESSHRGGLYKFRGLPEAKARP